jgi:uracil-DNA glycosylase family 4
MPHSAEFLEEMLREAKQYLPGWLYSSLMKSARARAGGRSKYRKSAPSAIEKLALNYMRPEELKALSDEELQFVWGQLTQWYTSARRQREAVEPIVNSALKVRQEIQRRKLSVPSSALIEATGELEALTKNDSDLVKGLPDVASTGPYRAKVAFIEASLDPLEKARQEQLVGTTGACFVDKYLGPLGLTKDEVYLTSLVPQVLKGLDGYRRDPRPAEIELWKESQVELLKQYSPEVVIALGRTVSKALADTVDFTLPHPTAMVRLGDNGEVARKMKRIKATIKERTKVIKALTRKLQKSEGGTRSDKAEAEWNKDWFDRMPKSGKGKFAYQHHWRGLTEDEIGLTDPALMRDTDHSIHGDLRMEGNDNLWGYTVFLGNAAKNRNLDNLDRLIDIDSKERLEVVPKLEQPKEWLEVGTDKPFVSEPGEVGAPANTYAKFFLKDSGTYEIGVVRQNAIEVKLDGKHLKGLYLITLAPIGDRKRWLILKPKNQTPIAERSDLADILRELKTKKERYLVWAKPGEKPRFIDVNTGQDVDKKVDIRKADPVKRIVYGVVLDPYGKNGPEADAHNDWNPPAEIERTAHEYLKRSRVVGLQHAKKADAQVVESFVEQYPTRADYLAAMQNKDHSVYRRPFGSDVLHSGAWVMGVQLGPKEWKLYEDGSINCFSPGGVGFRNSLTRDQMPKITFIDLSPKEK